MAKKRDNNSGEYRDALRNHKIPILTLDVRWHTLFPDYEKTPRMKSLEKELNNLIKKQGKLSTGNKEMKKLKKRLMNEIVENMEAAEEGKGTPLQEKKVDKSQQLILEINDKMKDADRELLSIPEEIQKVNQELMIEGMQVCYDRIQENTESMQELSKEIKELRDKLQTKILEKNDREMKTDRIYTYMHSMLGPGVMEILDRQKGIKRMGRGMDTADDLSGFPAAERRQEARNAGILETEASDLEDEDLDAPVGTGNRILKPRKGAMGNRGYGASNGHQNRVKTKAQEQSEQERKRLNLVKQLEEIDKQQEMKSKRAGNQAETENRASEKNGVENNEPAQTSKSDFMEERKKKLEERRAAIKRRRNSEK